jgi:hypothetical protein
MVYVNFPINGTSGHYIVIEKAVVNIWTNKGK